MYMQYIALWPADNGSIDGRVLKGDMIYAMEYYGVSRRQGSSSAI